MQQVLDFFIVAKDQAGDGESRLADLGEFDAAAMTYEQLGAVSFLKFLHLSGKRRLGNMQHFRGTGEAAMRGNGVE